MGTSMRRTLQGTSLALTVTLMFATVGCSLFLSAESRYLMSVKNRATESDVRQHLGKPMTVTSDESGQKILIYLVRRQIQQGTNNAWTTVDAWQCDTYTLTFDNQQILRAWQRTSEEC